MHDEPTARRPGFTQGTVVTLADSGEWALPAPVAATHVGLEFENLLRWVAGAEDRADLLRAELALTIFWLTSNYDLPPDQLNALLSFEAGDPRLQRLQETVHGLAVDALRSLAPAPPLDDPTRPREGIVAGVLKRWKRWTASAGSGKLCRVDAAPVARSNVGSGLPT